MNTRIRYIKQTDGSYISSRFIPIKEGEARAIIEPDIKKGTVFVNNNLTGIEVRGTSLHKIKIAIKNLLVELGAEFEKEKRTFE